MKKHTRLMIAGFVAITAAAQMFLADALAQWIWSMTGLGPLATAAFGAIEVYVLYFAIRLMLWRLTNKGIGGWVLYRPADEQPKKPTTDYPELVASMVDSQRYR